MDTAFPYSQHVSGKHFIGRKTECVLLGNLLSQGEHVSIYEPPKAGKTSLIQQTLFNMRMSGKTFLVGQLSCLNIRTAEAFLLRMGSTLIRMVASTPAEYGQVCRRYLDGTHFVFDEKAFAEQDSVLSLSWEMDQEDIFAMLRLPFRLAADRGEKMILILDEFQNISFTDEDGDRVLRPLAAVIKEMGASGMKDFCFIFCGSMVNAMKEIFERSILLRRYVEHVSLPPVDARDIADHVYKGFMAGGKVVNMDLLIGACNLLKCNFWYINHFAAICDSLTRGYILEPVLNDTLARLIAIHEPRFRAMVNSLTTHQVNFLRATVDGVTRFSASEIIRKYGLNSSANVKRVKDALMKKELLTFDEADNPSFLDPLFEYWVRKFYFEVAE